MTLQTEPFNKHRAIKTAPTSTHITWCWKTQHGYAFKYVGEKPILDIEAQEIQTEDFHMPPLSHGFKRFSSRIVDGLFFCTWVCFEDLQ